MRKVPRKVVFSEFYIKNLKPGPVPYLRWDAKQAGFAVRVEPSGHKAWKAIYKFGGRKRDYHIDAVAKIGIADARKLAGRIMLQVAEGTDPQAIKRAARGAGTFDDIADRYLEFSKRKNKSWRQADSLVQKHLRPKWGKLSAANISRSDVKAMMARIKAPIVANQTLAAASAIYSFAIKEELGGVKVNPCHGVERNATQTRERVLSATEIPLFWKAFDETGAQGAALKVLLLLGQRPGETASMRTEHFIDGWWEMPGDPIEQLGWPGTKNAQSHRVWISAPAREIIAAMDADGFVFAGSRGGAINSIDVTMREICKKLDVERATPHDLRRTNGTLITALGFGREAMNRIQNHKEGGIASVYDRHQYAEENKRILETVGAHIMALVEGAPRGNVVPFAVNAL
jgi:integrase